jgi:hypothetical protein
LRCIIATRVDAPRRIKPMRSVDRSKTWGAAN